MKSNRTFIVVLRILIIEYLPSCGPFSNNDDSHPTNRQRFCDSDKNMIGETSVTVTLFMTSSKCIENG